MADSLNIKNPSVTKGELDLRTDASGNIVSISGHPIAGGGGGGTTYYGDNEYIQIKNGTVNTFTVTDKVKDVVDNLDEKISLQIYEQTYNKNDIDTKLSSKQDELVFEGYDDKIETINGSGFIVNGYVSDFEYQIDKNNFNKKIDYLSASVSGKEDKLTFEYDEDNKVSAINGSALAGQGGTTYTPGQYINIDSNNEISVTGLVAADEYATYSGDWNDVSNSYKTNSGSFLTSEALTNYATKTYVDGKDPVLIGDSNITAASSTVDGHTQWNLAVNVTPVVTDTKLVGDNCVTAHTTQTSGEWIVGLEQTAYEAIGSVGGISTDVTTLKNASANWNKVSDKLDTTAAAQTYLEKATYSNASGKWENASNVVATNSANWDAKVDQNDLDDYYEKTNTSSKTELSTEFAKYQVTGDYVTQSDISDMATQTWVGEQGFYTKASGDNDYAPKSVTATINTLTGASAGWNEVTAKLDKSIYSNASGNWENTYNVVNQYSAAGTWLTEHQSLTNYYQKTETSSKTELSDEFAKYVTSSNVTTQGTDYVMTTTGWKVLTLPGGGMTQVIHDETLTGQGNANDNKLSVAWSALSGNTIYSAKSAGSATSALSADKAESSVSAKWLREGDDKVSAGDVTALQHWASSNSSTWNDVSAKLTTAQYATDSATFVTKPDTTQTVLNNNYLIYSTLTDPTATTGWMPLSANYYSKTEADGRYQKKEDMSNYLPLSGGTVSGKTTISGSDFNNTLEVKRAGQDNNYAHIGLNNSRGLSFKAFDANASTNVQFDLFPNNSNSSLIQVQHNGSTVGNLIPAVTATTTAGITNDGILHIILES